MTNREEAIKHIQDASEAACNGFCVGLCDCDVKTNDALLALGVSEYEISGYRRITEKVVSDQ